MSTLFQPYVVATTDTSIASIPDNALVLINGIDQNNEIGFYRFINHYRAETIQDCLDKGFYSFVGGNKAPGRYKKIKSPQTGFYKIFNNYIVSDGTGTNSGWVGTLSAEIVVKAPLSQYGSSNDYALRFVVDLMTQDPSGSLENHIHIRDVLYAAEVRKTICPNPGPCNIAYPGIAVIKASGLWLAVTHTKYVKEIEIRVLDTNFDRYINNIWAGNVFEANNFENFTNQSNFAPQGEYYAEWYAIKNGSGTIVQDIGQVVNLVSPPVNGSYPEHFTKTFYEFNNGLVKVENGNIVGQRYSHMNQLYFPTFTANFSIPRNFTGYIKAF